MEKHMRAKPSFRQPFIFSCRPLAQASDAIRGVPACLPPLCNTQIHTAAISKKENNHAHSAASGTGSSVTTSWRRDVPSSSGNGAAKVGTPRRKTSKRSTKIGKERSKGNTKVNKSHKGRLPVNKTLGEGLDLAHQHEAPMKHISSWNPSVPLPEKSRQDGSWNRRYKSRCQHSASIAWYYQLQRQQMKRSGRPWIEPQARQIRQK